MWNFKNTITGTLTGVRISAVDGCAFLDNCSDLLPYMDGRSRIQLLDSSGRILEGVLGLRGVSEGLTQKVINGDFSSADNWTAESSWSIADGVASYDAVSNGKRLNQIGWSTTVNQLVNVTFDISAVNKASIFFLDYIGGSAIGSATYTLNFKNPPLASGSYSYCVTWNYWGLAGTGIGIYAYNEVATSGAFTLDNLTLSHVIAPSNTGCLIKNDSGVQNFVSKDASFAYNAASYTYKLFTNVRI